jgi:hypothetical protein
MSILTELANHKAAIIAAGGAVLLLAAYVIPWDSLLETASAAKGGTGGTGGNGNHNGNDNPNRYKVCEKKEAQGKDKLPQKCYGITG